MTCPNASDPSEKCSRALDAERRRSEFRLRAFETLLLYLITYEMPVEKVRTFLERIETQALRGFPDLAKAGWRADACLELLERLLRVEDSTVAKELKLERCPPQPSEIQREEERDVVVSE